MARYALLLMLLLATALTASAGETVPASGEQMKHAVRAIVAAVNAGDADAYVAPFADDVEVYMIGGELRIAGRDALRRNRAQHFTRHPEVRNELVHLVAIDDRVVMHDRVLLRPGTDDWADIVEIYTFADGEIVRVDVLQPRRLFGPGTE
ncbi:MAG: nuclear transport factor 2 family protein [Pseudomonadota bacterium]